MATFKGGAMRQSAGNKNAAKRPEAKEGGREEEKKRFRIATGLTAPGRLRSNKETCKGVHLVTGWSPAARVQFPAGGASSR